MTSKEYEMVCKTLNELHQRVTALEAPRRATSSVFAYECDDIAATAARMIQDRFDMPPPTWPIMERIICEVIEQKLSIKSTRRQG